MDSEFIVERVMRATENAKKKQRRRTFVENTRVEFLHPTTVRSFSTKFSDNASPCFVEGEATRLPILSQTR